MTNSNKDKVLVTGVSGFVGAQVLNLLLSRGYWVRGTVRSQKKADQIIAKYPQYKDKLEIVLVEDIAKEGAFEGALHGIEGVFHVASPFHFKVTDVKADLLEPAIKGTTGILETALKVPSVKRVVITSSFAAVFDGDKVKEGHVFTEKDWNPITEEQATNPSLGYRASKKLAEKAAWDFVEAKKPHFDIVAINPPMIYGPIEHHIDKLDELNESARQFCEFATGIKPVAPTTLDLYVDVRDVALAEVLAYENPKASNQRFIIANGNFSWQEVVDVAHKYFSGKTKADVGQPGAFHKPIFHVDNSKSITELGVVYHVKEETFKDTIAQLLAFQEKGL